ncbi:Qb-SNARE 1 [Giardia muris]|uniref:Qb-SNARE 1 n=1 Tax=Giardia muris TaxID=5742 RepID=A0A4Z1SXC5_GIAMU|nr:Qb-SNARE 1 [Giardia muris]|eukprot:TNJ30190.1 Qb-SNARE 1 [Giardia muris]
MTLADAYISEMQTLIGETQALLRKAETADPFSRDDVTAEAKEKLRSAWTIYAKLGTQLTHLGDTSAAKSYREVQRGLKETLDGLEEEIRGARVMEKTTGYTPQRHLAVSRSYEAERACMDSAERSLDVAYAQAHAAAHTSLDTLALLQGQEETIEHAARGANKTGEALRSGRLTSQRIRIRADKHRFLMNLLLGLDGSLLAIGMIVRLVLRFIKK